ncbi:hypothetical protein EII29_00890 [Leptotrichia sp. OH3620_COT-345]|uniref:hypothetical protein n=1 Tax=Leptotrichia sp. OH3620_COT-345 TaxID=2491048 RepID=UPI000F654873|nr:hypothetical protein [Leptotrichia sp. OH3620_COT-345]RRD41037.1 hypothetical protein EII29_00890 [Leptotrichia sp. OH3620_COT-345]
MTGENEGANYYNKDLRVSHDNKRRIYSEDEIQNNIDWWYGKGKFTVNWNTYKISQAYREKVNYYCFQSKYALRDVKYEGKSDEDGKKIIISYRTEQGGIGKMEMNKVSETESIYHNLEYRNGTVYLNFNGKNKKYVGSNGEEVILDGNNKAVYDPSIIGTYNYYSYPVDSDITNVNKLKHKLDIDLWIKYGTGPTDMTNPKLRESIGSLALGELIMRNYKSLKELANKNNNRGRLSLEQLISKNSKEKFLFIKSVGPIQTRGGGF